MKKITAVLLCIAIIISVTPVVAAQNVNNDVVNTISQNTTETQSQPYIVGEIPEKRTKDTKYFLMSDRTVTAAVYNKAVHYYNDGAWLNIDNSLSDNQENEFENKSNAFKTKFSKKSNGNKLVTLKKDNYSLSWVLDNAKKVDAQISPSNEMETEDISVLKNLTGSVTYPEIQNNVDLQYVVSGENIKENIILQSEDAPAEYTFTYKSNKLSYRTNDDSQIELYDENTPEDIVFTIDKPYMYDSNNAYSNNIEMQVLETNNGFKLKLIPDKEWLLSEDRAYPIVIDPTTLSSQKATDVWDITLQSTQTQALNYVAYDFLVGSDTSGQKYRTMLKISNLPNIGVGGIVVNAKVYFYRYGLLENPQTTMPAFRPRPTDDIQVNIHRINELWPQQGAIWNNYAECYDSIIEDYFIYNDTDDQFNADITNLVNDWYKGTANYGIMLKANNESAANHVMQFASSDFATYESSEYRAVRPYLTVNYRTCIGLEDYWSYTTQDMGGYGTGYVNLYNGNLVYVHDDVSFNSLINGFTLSHVYNSANTVKTERNSENKITVSAAGTGNYGKGWGLNLVQRIDPVSIENTNVRYVYTDGDGTKHYFVELENGDIVDEDGLGYTHVNINESVDSGDTPLKHKITTKEGTVLKFDVWGFLRRIIDTNNNTIILNYSPGPTTKENYITSINTSSGGTFALVYDTNRVLTSIIDNANRTTSFSYTNGNLTKITYPDGTDLDFNYNETTTSVPGHTSWLQKITLPDNFKYCYTNYDNGKIEKATTKSADNVVGSELTYTYANFKTNVKDLNDKSINYQFDSFGRVTCAYDSDGNSYAQTYEATTNASNNIFKNNKLNKLSNNIRYINNLITNPVFSNGLTSWTEYKEAPGQTQISVVTNQGYISSNTVKIQSTASSIQALLQVPNTIVGKTYTLSANLKTENIASQNRGAGVEIVTSTPNGNKYYYSDFITGTTDTQINSGFVTASVTAAMASNENIIRISVGLYNASGTVYIDSVQLEEGDTANKINLLSNSSFEKNSGINTLPTGFTGDIASNGGGVTNSVTFTNGGAYTMKFTGNTTAFRSARQAVNISGQAGDVFSYGGWAKANSIPKHSTGDIANFQMCVKVHYTDTSTEWFKCEFNPYTDEWQYAQSVFSPKANYTKLELCFGYDYNANTAYFDNVFLYRDTAQSYTYDNDGNVVSTADYAKQQSSFEYSDNYLSKTVEPTGTKYTYKYDDEKNVVNASSNVGIDYNIAYDNYGNATQTTIVPGGDSEIDQYGGVYYIKNKSSGQYLTVSGGECVRANINQQPLTNAPLQRWRVKKLSNGNYIMRPDGCNEHALAYEDRSVVNTTVLLGVTGADVETYDWSQWSLIANNDEEHSFKIKTMATNCVTKFISIATSDTTNGGNIYMDYDGSTDNKSWIFIPANEIITSSATYQNSGNFPHTVTDSLGNTTTYTYDTARGLQTGVTDANGNTTSYVYNQNNDRLESVSLGGSTVEYNYYTNGRLYGICSPSATRYAFNYDEFGNTSEIYVEQRQLVENQYDNLRGLLLHSTYGNNHKISYNYNSLDQLVEKLYNNTVKVKFRYDKFGNLYEKQDLFTGTTYRYGYDLSGRITDITGSNNTRLNYVYDNYNRVKNQITRVNNNTNNTEYIYGDSSVSGQKNGLIYGVKQNGTQRLSYSYDAFARLSKKTINTTTPFEITYNYLTDVTEGTTSTVVRNMLIGDDYHNYFYDSVGNIIKYGINGSHTNLYTYDAKNQLKTETRPNGDVYEYTYDNGGNILNVKKNNALYKSYTYGDRQWYDLLTEYNGDSITYDAIGNPLQYRDDFEFTWQNGRQLYTVTDSDNFITYYQYNADGLRSYKNAYGLVVNYHWIDGLLIAQNTGPKYTIFLYDEAGSPYGFVYDNVYYYYIKNQQGDVIGILDADGNIIVNYEYSAWGEILSITGTHADTIGQLNPLRYRGYYYDDETGFYYLQSRYYDPVTCRFINADSLLNQESVIGYNMFAYCLNNPVNMTDTTGDLPFFVVTAAIGAVVGAVVGGVKAAKSGKSVLKGALVGAAVGGLAGAGLGAVASAALVGSVAATTTQVMIGAGQLVSTIAAGGLGAGGFYLANNLQQAVNNIAPVAQTTSSVTQTSSRGSNRRIEPTNLLEQLAMEKVKADPFAGTQLSNITLNDPRWPSSEGWVKMQQIIQTSQGDINIHYVYNSILKIFDDFKFNP